jgi:hypothetical protein
LALFERRLSARVNSLGMPASENLHTNGLKHRSQQHPNPNRVFRARTRSLIAIHLNTSLRHRVSAMDVDAAKHCNIIGETEKPRAMVLRRPRPRAALSLWLRVNDW